MTRFLTSVSAIALTALPAFGQEAMDLDAITVFAGLEETTTLQTGVSVDVITEEDLEETGEVRVVDFLARQPGVTLRATGPVGAVTGLSLRGISQNNVAVRVDGIDVSDPSGTQVAFDFGSLLTSDISRIEILRGAQSAIYGSEALGGAINITTKRAARDGVSFDTLFEVGSFNTRRASVSALARGAGYETSVTLSYLATDGFSAGDTDAPDLGTVAPNDTNGEADGFEARRLSFSGRYDIGAATLEVSAFTETSEFDYDESSAGNVYDGTPDDVTERDQRGLRAALSFTTGAVDHTLAASAFVSDRVLSGTSVDTFSGVADGAYIGTPYPFEFQYTGRRTELSYQAGFDLNAGTRAVLGLQRTVERYEDDIAGASSFGPYGSAQEHETDVNSVFGELTYAPSGDIDLSLALRHDDHSEYGGYTTGRLSAVWRVQPDLILRANAATGYRAPSNYELFAAFAGNPDLEPETSKSFDLGIEKRWGEDAYLRATAFYIEAEDIIDYSFTTFAYTQRSGTATRKGLELAGGLTLGQGVRLDGSYTLTESDADVTLDSSSWTTTVPRHTLALSLSADLGQRAGVTVTGLYEADREGGLVDYGLINTTFTYDLTDEAQAYLRLENLLDEDYQTVPGYGQSGRAAYFGVRASF
ncbi:TonB-dependent receptor plug domain-containing protein [Aestuariicoccus sp. MJ-SS9]|uniref:TonB-dependent receptor plug domain-containing protein n=1 Tax=Aestuariicoccus sp. MJ-SS9 TaxID=3079855 RepID=UPI00290A374C|nr:TonB-dependent receptor [Aestuariicoccus sp. MJ-SS9]MDU8913690.1 TonB-dependent receptor [Aestuariicoccus sp. MJ-SS9]